MSFRQGFLIIFLISFCVSSDFDFLRSLVDQIKFGNEKTNLDEEIGSPFVLNLDISRSIFADLPYLKIVAKEIVQYAPETTVITTETNPRIVCETCTPDLSFYHIMSLNLGESTNLEGSLALTSEYFKNQTKILEDTPKVTLLISDGLVDSLQKAKGELKKLLDSGIQVFIMEVGKTDEDKKNNVKLNIFTINRLRNLPSTKYTYSHTFPALATRLQNFKSSQAERRDENSMLPSDTVVLDSTLSLHFERDEEGKKINPSVVSCKVSFLTLYSSSNSMIPLTFTIDDNLSGFFESSEEQNVTINTGRSEWTSIEIQNCMNFDISSSSNNKVLSIPTHLRISMEPNHEIHMLHISQLHEFEFAKFQADIYSLFERKLLKSQYSKRASALNILAMGPQSVGKSEDLNALATTCSESIVTPFVTDEPTTVLSKRMISSLSKRKYDSAILGVELISGTRRICPTMNILDMFGISGGISYDSLADLLHGKVAPGTSLSQYNSSTGVIQLSVGEEKERKTFSINRVDVLWYYLRNERIEDDIKAYKDVRDVVRQESPCTVTLPILVCKKTIKCGANDVRVLKEKLKKIGVSYPYLHDSQLFQTVHSLRSALYFKRLVDSYSEKIRLNEENFDVCGAMESTYRNLKIYQYSMGGFIIFLVVVLVYMNYCRRGGYKMKEDKKDKDEEEDSDDFDFSAFKNIASTEEEDAIRNRRVD